MSLYSDRSFIHSPLWLKKHTLSSLTLLFQPACPSHTVSCSYRLHKVLRRTTSIHTSLCSPAVALPGSPELLFCLHCSSFTSGCCCCLCMWPCLSTNTADSKSITLGPVSLLNSGWALGAGMWHMSKMNTAPFPPPWRYSRPVFRGC